MTKPGRGTRLVTGRPPSRFRTVCPSSPVASSRLPSPHSLAAGRRSGTRVRCQSRLLSASPVERHCPVRVEGRLSEGPRIPFNSNQTLSQRVRIARPSGPTLAPRNSGGVKFRLMKCVSSTAFLLLCRTTSIWTANRRFDLGARCWYPLSYS